MTQPQRPTGAGTSGLDEWERLIQEADVYEKAGWTAELVDVLIQLADIVIQDQDYIECASLAAKLRRYAEGERAELALCQLEDLMAGASQQFSQDLHHEVHAAHRLLEAGLLRRAQYRTIIRELKKQEPETGGGFCTLLHILQAQQYPDLMSLTTYLSRDSGIPLLPLTRFEHQQEAFICTGEELARRGALGFGFLGKRVMVAVLNPYNNQLQDAVRAVSGRACLFYLVLATDYDATFRHAMAEAQHKMQES